MDGLGVFLDLYLIGLKTLFQTKFVLPLIIKNFWGLPIGWQMKKSSPYLATRRKSYFFM